MNEARTAMFRLTFIEDNLRVDSSIRFMQNFSESVTVGEIVEAYNFFKIKGVLINNIITLRDELVRQGKVPRFLKLSMLCYSALLPHEVTQAQATTITVDDQNKYAADNIMCPGQLLGLDVLVYCGPTVNTTLLQVTESPDNIV